MYIANVFFLYKVSLQSVFIIEFEEIMASIYYEEHGEGMEGRTTK